MTIDDAVRLTVARRPSGDWMVCEAGFETAIAEFESRDEATRYALRFAATRPRWQVDVVDNAGDVLETYNSEDVAAAKE